MVALFRRPGDDLQLLRGTVESLGATSVPGLAAALSWRERRTERALVEELSRPGTPLTYDPALRLVRWAPTVLEETIAPVTAERPDPPLSAASTAPMPAPRLAPSGSKLSCPSCHVSLVPAAAGSLVVCPNCGRLATTPGAEPATPAPERAAEPSAAPARGTTPIPDRRSQELFAAYVTAKPIPCPRCRTPLRHKGLSEYSCPSCGETVRFASAAAPPPPPSTPRPPSPGIAPRPDEPRPQSPPASSASPVPFVPTEPVPQPPPRTTSRTEIPYAEARAVETTPWVAVPPASDPGLESARGRLRRSIAGLGRPTSDRAPRAPTPQKSEPPRARASCRVAPRAAK